MNNELEIWVRCSSEKECCFLEFGTCLSPEEKLDGIDWVYEGISDSFWENYSDFEPGIDKARQLVHNNPSMSFKEALFEMFGHFSVTYQVNGCTKKLNINVDYDETIYSILGRCS